VRTRRHLCPGASRGARTRFFPRDVGFRHPLPVARHYTTSPLEAASCGGGFRDRCHSLSLQASWMARHTDCHHTRGLPPCGCGFDVRARLASLPPRASDLLVVRTGPLTT
jgi:hypothetical protein